MLIALLSIVAGGAEAAEKSPPVVSLSKTYNWKMTAWFPAGHDDNKQLIQFIDTLNKRTNGGVKVTLYEATLGSPNDHWDMVPAGCLSALCLVCLLNFPICRICTRSTLSG
jgi:TRAP-type C4-dicarboxylate transport system substrate-binding protein